MIFLKIAISAALLVVATYLPLKWNLFHKESESEEEAKNSNKVEMIFGLTCGALIIIAFITFFIGIWLA